jgi:hypothetical protein
MCGVSIVLMSGLTVLKPGRGLLLPQRAQEREVRLLVHEAA